MKNFVHADRVELVRSGNDYFDRLCKLISSAQKVIHLQTFIFENDDTGRLVAHELIDAARKGVQVFLLVDSYGSRRLPNALIHEMVEAGINFRKFSRFFTAESVSVFRRMHHKILVVDKSQALIGGINIGDRYKGTKTEHAWLDFAIYIEGESLQYINTLCENYYAKKNKPIEEIPGSGAVPVRYSRNDYYRRKNEIYTVYRNAVKTSQESVTFISSYFLPGYFFLRRIKNAVKRGVKVRILLGGVSDVPFFHYAEKYLYRYLLKTGVEIYEWKQSVMHGKMAIFDTKMVTIGSYNLNNLSKFQCIELNVDVRDSKFANETKVEVDQILKEDCQRITPELWTKNQNIFRRLFRFLGYHSYRRFMNLLAPFD